MTRGANHSSLTVKTNIDLEEVDISYLHDQSSEPRLKETIDQSTLLVVDYPLNDDYEA